MTTKVAIVAAKRFTTALASGFILHMDPKDKRAGEMPQLVKTEVPEEDVKALLDRGFIEDPYKGKKSAKAEPTPAPADTGGDEPAYKLKHSGGSWWIVEGPDGTIGDKSKDKDAVAAEVYRLNTGGELKPASDDTTGTTGAEGDNGGGGNPDEGPAS